MSTGGDAGGVSTETVLAHRAWGRPGTTPLLEVDALLADRSRHILICCGSGGVGKTSVSAALALRAAEQGRRVVVLTIDPARRLAQSLGVAELDNTPRPVASVDRTAGGSLDAMMLDMKRTFDDVVTTHASPEKAEQILSNPFYEALSTSFSGTQEYMAMEKLGQLSSELGLDRGRGQEARWDLIVVDTPPSRSALDFLDAPEHLSSLLDGRLLRLLLNPARGPMRLMGAGLALVTSAMSRVLGAQVLTDVQTFVSAFETLFGGFRQRAEATLANLASPHTTFLVVATPEREALREASFFVERLRDESLPLAGVVVNRLHGSAVALSPERAWSMAEDLPQDGLEAVALRSHATRMHQVLREREAVRRFGTAAPGLPLTTVAALPGDVTALADLRAVGELLAAEDR
ncbi:ArsA family ATPase [Auraticoccus monumenti]|uniref:Anion-transporting ATPase, ArsA/GET3 family n=1 Tax=Auraticoccus monumenti TaxID=675864 RepID=A0A1G6S3R5_9ACTN|nr:ArsA-related P-loop ATPase [Auraticoccus monumenti]SDD11314.1 Anion-transporting ATPase, ArsA/GET3 family [Auraticoccus monumenti]